MVVFLVPFNLLGGAAAAAGLLDTEGILLEVEVAELGRLGIRLGPVDLLEGNDDSTGWKTCTFAGLGSNSQHL